MLTSEKYYISIFLYKGREGCGIFGWVGSFWDIRTTGLK
jgi:hypothetical protein